MSPELARRIRRMEEAGANCKGVAGIRIVPRSADTPGAGELVALVLCRPGVVPSLEFALRLRGWCADRMAGDGPDWVAFSTAPGEAGPAAAEAHIARGEAHDLRRLRGRG